MVIIWSGEGFEIGPRDTPSIRSRILCSYTAREITYHWSDNEWLRLKCWKSMCNIFSLKLSLYAPTMVALIRPYGLTLKCLFTASSDGCRYVRGNIWGGGLRWSTIRQIKISNSLHYSSFTTIDLDIGWLQSYHKDAHVKIGILEPSTDTIPAMLCSTHELPIDAQKKYYPAATIKNGLCRYDECGDMLKG